MHDRSDRSPHHHDAGNGASPKQTHISEVIAEFSEIFASARSNWVRFAESVHPELSGGAMMVLQFITRKGPVTATGISQVMQMDKAMLSRQIAKLRELGLVEAEPAPEDRRVQLLTASARANELMDGIRAQWAHSYHERFADWTPEEVASFRSALHRFNASAGRPADGPATRCAREHRESAAG